MTRLALAEAERAPELARRLDRGGPRPTRAALDDFLIGAVDRRLIGEGDTQTMAGQFLSLLWGDLQMTLLLRVAGPWRRPRASDAQMPRPLYPVPCQSAR